MNRKKTPLDSFLDLFSDEDDPNEPVFDPVHLGTTVVVCLVGIGCLYWLLWTLLVFEGGLFRKVGAAALILFTSKTPGDFGFEGAPYAMGIFEGWFGNTAALILTGIVVAGLANLYRDAAKKRRTR